MNKTVFLSFTHEDTNIAERIREVLTKGGLTIYMPGEELCLGKSCIKQVSAAMNGSDVVLAIMTKNSVDSPWLNQELGYAMASGKKTILLVGKNVPVSGLYSGKENIRFNEEDPESAIASLPRVISSNSALNRALKPA